MGCKIKEMRRRSDEYSGPSQEVYDFLRKVRLDERAVEDAANVIAKIETDETFCAQLDSVKYAIDVFEAFLEKGGIDLRVLFNHKKFEELSQCDTCGDHDCDARECETGDGV